VPPRNLSCLSFAQDRQEMVQVMYLVAHPETQMTPPGVPASPRVPASAGVSTAPFLAMNGWSLLAYILSALVICYTATGAYGKTNQQIGDTFPTLLTPAGWTFNIWGPILLWEGLFAVVQMLPPLRGSAVVQVLTPWWLATCFLQVLWQMTFSHLDFDVAIFFKLGIFGSLLGLCLTVDNLRLTAAEYWLCRAPFSLHLGWVIIGTLVNITTAAEERLLTSTTMMALTIAALAYSLAVAALLSLCRPEADPIIPLPLAWGFLGIWSELDTMLRARGESTQTLPEPNERNPYGWGEIVLNGFKDAALFLSISCLFLSITCAVLRLMGVTLCGGKRRALTMGEADDSTGRFIPMERVHGPRVLESPGHVAFDK